MVPLSSFHTLPQVSQCLCLSFSLVGLVCSWISWFLSAVWSQIFDEVKKLWFWGFFLLAFSCYLCGSDVLSRFLALSQKLGIAFFIYFFFLDITTNSFCSINLAWLRRQSSLSSILYAHHVRISITHIKLQQWNSPFKKLTWCHCIKILYIMIIK